MPELDVPEPPKLSQQILLSAIVIIVTGLLLAVFVKIALGVVIFLLGTVMGIGSQAAKNRSNKE